MRMDLKTPCAGCPFRNDRRPYLTVGRAEQIVESITDLQQSFQCHKTVEWQEEPDGTETPLTKEGDQHCAGALIMLEKMERPNQWMRIAERLGCYDRSRLKMDAPVYDSGEEMIAAHEAAR
jgi:hypothetical protein